MNSSKVNRVGVPYVPKPRQMKGSPSLLTMITSPGRSGVFCAPTAITESSDGTGTRIYFEGWLNISKDELDGLSL